MSVSPPDPLDWGRMSVGEEPIPFEVGLRNDVLIADCGRRNLKNLSTMGSFWPMVQGWS